MDITTEPGALFDNHRGVHRLGGAGIRRFRPRGGHQNSPFRGRDYMIPYMVGRLVPNSSHLTRGLVKYVPGRGYFRAVSFQNGKICYIPPLPTPIVELVHPRRKNKVLLLDITIVTPCASSNLENEARYAGNHLADAVERKKNK